MRLTITILSGTRAGQRILLASGETLRVGRTGKAGIAIADDPTMSSVHYEVLCDEAGALICDLESRNGLFVNGEPVKQVTLNSGDQIRAGRTFFSVALERSADGDDCRLDDETTAPADATRAVLSPTAARMIPPPLEAASPTGDRHWTKAAQTLGPEINRSNDPLPPLVPSPGGLYAVADGVLAQTLLQQAKRRHRRVESLLTGGMSPYLAAVAPYLIQIEDDGGFLSIWQPMLNHGHGIVVVSKADFDEVVVHARSIFCGRDDAGRPSYFRFYDSKLLYAWLCGCHGPQLESFFGCFTCVIVALEGGSRWMRLTHAGGELGAEEIYAP